MARLPWVSSVVVCGGGSSRDADRADCDLPHSLMLAGTDRAAAGIGFVMALTRCIFQSVLGCA